MPPNASSKCCSAVSFSPFRLFSLLSRRTDHSLWWVSEEHCGHNGWFQHGEVAEWEALVRTERWRHWAQAHDTITCPQVLVHDLSTIHIRQNAAQQANARRPIASKYPHLSCGLLSLLPLWGWPDWHCTIWPWEWPSCHHISVTLVTAVFSLCGRVQGRFWRFTVTVILVVCFSVTSHLETYRLNDFILSTGCRGDSRSPDGLSVFLYISGEQVWRAHVAFFP